MHWIWSNKEWLFSGVAVWVIGTLLTLWFRRRTPATSQNTATISANSMIASPVATGSNISQTVNVTHVAQAVATTNDEYSPRPSPTEILTQLRSLPAFQQKEARKAYVGIKVDWRVSFSSMTEVSPFDGHQSGSTHRVYLYPPEGHVPFVTVDVDIEQIPRLKVTHDETPMNVTGIISSVEPLHIELKDAKLSFVD